jgi:uncharacterized membrane protein
VPLDPVALAKGIQAFAGFTLAGYVAAAISGVVRGEVRQARLRVAEGVVTALGLMLPATILRTLAVRDWDQIQSLAFVLAMRVVVKHFFAWEKPRLGGSRA